MTFVVSLSVAISLQLTPKKDSRLPEARPAAGTSPQAPAAVFSPPVAIPAPVADTPLAPPPEAPPVEFAPPPVESPVGVPEAPADAARAGCPSSCRHRRHYRNKSLRRQ